MPDPVQLDREALLESVHDTIWFHSVDLGGGLVTTGIKSAPTLENEWATMQLPNLHGKSVLDIGAWDGYFSFAAEQHGAERVVALDHYAWSMDLVAQQQHMIDHMEQANPPVTFERVESVWQPHTLPGKAGFDAARQLRGSSVTDIVGDFMAMDLALLGTFDVVFFLGVLYHLFDPYLALRRLAEVTEDLAVVETACVVVPDREHHALWEFFETTELNGDPSNWWAPNILGLQAALRAAGFARIEVKAAPPADAAPVGHEWHYGRAVVHAYKR